MSARITTPAFGRRSARAAAVVSAILAAGVSAAAMAQQVVNPGDIIVERDVTPRSAFDNVPKNQDPVLVRATTFPANTFDPTMATIVSDTDLTNARGSSGVSTSGAEAAGMTAITRILSGNATGSNTALGAGPSASQMQGIGTTISSTVTNALAPISSALGSLK